jgi:alcohol dehydrogenase
VLIRIAAAGLCHSDLSVINGDRPRPMPMALGHEAAGVVEELGRASPTCSVATTWSSSSSRAAAIARLVQKGGRRLRTGRAANGSGTLLSGSGVCRARGSL